jgi:replicative superfamily II helicase
MVWIDRTNHLLIDYNACVDKLLKGLMKTNQDNISFHPTEIKHVVSEINLTVMEERNWQNGAE